MIRIFHKNTRYVWARTAIITAIGITATGCAFGDDPTTPRPIREVKPVKAPAHVSPETDESSPSRGLPCAKQTGPIRICGAATDNYKASFNEDSSTRETRTWLAINQLEIAGKRYKVAPGQSLLEERLILENRASNPNETITVSARLHDESLGFVTMRNGPQENLWGPLLTVNKTPVKDTVQVIIQVQRVESGPAESKPTESELVVTYVPDELLREAPEASLEHNGLGGRWHVLDAVTATNLELGWE